jgi:hypothetical protein
MGMNVMWSGSPNADAMMLVKEDACVRDVEIVMTGAETRFASVTE